MSILNAFIKVGELNFDWLKTHDWPLYLEEKTTYFEELFVSKRFLQRRNAVLREEENLASKIVKAWYWQRRSIYPNEDAGEEGKPIFMNWERLSKDMARSWESLKMPSGINQNDPKDEAPTHLQFRRLRQIDLILRCFFLYVACKKGFVRFCSNQNDSGKPKHKHSVGEHKEGWRKLKLIFSLAKRHDWCDDQGMSRFLAEAEEVNKKASQQEEEAA